MPLPKPDPQVLTEINLAALALVNAEAKGKSAFDDDVIEHMETLATHAHAIHLLVTRYRELTLDSRNE